MPVLIFGIDDREPGFVETEMPFDERKCAAPDRAKTNEDNGASDRAINRHCGIESLRRIECLPQCATRRSRAVQARSSAAGRGCQILMRLIHAVAKLLCRARWHCEHRKSGRAFSSDPRRWWA